MMRYEARENGPYWMMQAGKKEPCWTVHDNDVPRFTQYATEAEAKIIEFALNAVADGLVLAAWHPHHTNRQVSTYIGPTL